jgi:nucleoside phosphorylase
MLRTFPNIRTVIMTGIAGGIPRPDEAAKHVRLGDVVVALDGIVPYASVRQEGAATRPRQRQRAGLVSSWLLGAARELEVLAQHGDRRWEHWLRPEESARAAAFPRPPEGTDRLYVRDRETSHPPRPDSGPPAGMPMVHYGVIGSADILLVDEDFRDRLAQEHPDMCAIEMEGAGIAAGTAAFDLTWFMVRGVADYCERTGRNDVWQPYAAYAAASYVRALLETAPPIGSEEEPPPETVQPRPLVSDEDQAVLDALLRRLPSDLELGPIWKAAAPELWDYPADVLSDPSVAYHFLARLNADASGLHPAMLFVALLSREVEDHDRGLAGRLRSWVDVRTEAAGTGEALRARLRPGSGAVTATPSVGPVLLIEMGLVGNDWGRCRITPYLQRVTGPWRPRPVTGAEVELEEAGQAVSRLVAEAERIWAQNNAAEQAEIEFLLPTGLLNLPVQWYPAPRMGDVQPICVRYPVAVRSAQRMRTETVRREWLSRWSRLDRKPFDGEVYWGIRYLPSPISAQAWSAGLSGDDRYVVVVLSEPPDTESGRTELVAALGAGVPVVLWDRLDRPVDEAAERMRRLIVEPARLPAEMRALRVEARQAAAEQPDHPGWSVALLWDDPHRVVDTRRAE